MLVDVSKKAYQDALTVKEERHNFAQEVFNIWKNQTYNLNFIQSKEVVLTSTSLSPLYFCFSKEVVISLEVDHSRSLVTGKPCCNQIIILLGGGKILQLVVSTY